MSVVVIAVLVLPLAAAAVTAVTRGRDPRLTGQLGAGATGVGFVLSVALAVRVAGHSEVSAVLTNGAGALVVGVSVDRLTVVLLLLVYVIGTVAQAFAVRYLHGDPRAGWFSVSACLLTAVTGAMVTSTTLVGMAACWTVGGVALCLLLSTYSHVPAARLGVTRTVTALVIGDFALWGAVAMVTARVGTVELRELGAALQGQSAVFIGAAAALVVVAALSRSAQIPFHRWLPATLAAPTPVSALLHAGVVNGGGMLLVRNGFLVGQSGFAMVLAAVAGGLTAVYGTAAMLAKPDVKGALVYSTTAQMGFMMLTCGVGLYGAAVFHLVAHGMYKATLFLNSGAAVARRAHASRWAPAPEITARTRFGLLAAALLLPALALTAALLIVPQSAAEHGSGAVLLVFGWATAAAATAGWLRRRHSPFALITVSATLVAAAAGYRVLVAGFTGFIDPALPPTTAPQVAVWAVVIAAVALAVLAVLRKTPTGGRVGSLHRSVYVAALSAGHVSVPHRPLREATISLSVRGAHQ
ncbi:proton-conducting transporter membrane subunit [Mycobacterium sp.]|uniref:proton-conducting transporter transmembrane domain-containing protein n=1 Tax=Mycobacterium sp. TaxID=1785 RepID=UPI0031E2DD89